MSSRVSVIVPTKNRSLMLREALASIRAIEGPGLELEVIVADNGSTDDTAEVACTFGARLVHAPTPGPAAARNAGLRAASGDYLAFLDDDDIWLPQHLRPHLDLLRTRPDLVAVVGQIVSIDPQTMEQDPPWPHQLPDNGDLFGNLLQYQPQIGATVARASVLESVGYLNESMIGGEDWEWHLRIALRHQVGFVRVPCVLFRQHEVGSRDELQWQRMVCASKAYWRMIRVAGPRRPSLVTAARVFLRYLGQLNRKFLDAAIMHADHGDREASRRALLWAVRSSPPHAARAFIGDGAVRGLVPFLMMHRAWRAHRRIAASKACKGPIR